MTCTAARTFTALAAVLLLGAGACSGSDDAAPDSTTTLAVTTPTTSGRLGELSDLDGAAAGLTGDALDCYNVQLAVFALAAVPSGYLAGSSQADLDSLQADLDTLRGQLEHGPTACRHRSPEPEQFILGGIGSRNRLAVDGSVTDRA